MSQAARRADFKERFGKGRKTARWAVTMAKVRIRQAAAKKPWPRWHFIDFCGKHGREARGVVDVIAVRKDHSEQSAQHPILKRGDALQIVLIQVKGGAAAKPTASDAQRLQIVARQHKACAVLLGTWKKGKSARFYGLSPRSEWNVIDDLATVFC